MLCAPFGAENATRGLPESKHTLSPPPHSLGSLAMGRLRGVCRWSHRPECVNLESRP